MEKPSVAVGLRVAVYDPFVGDAAIVLLSYEHPGGGESTVFFRLLEYH